jgi:universal stress protein A
MPSRDFFTKFLFGDGLTGGDVEILFSMRRRNKERRARAMEDSSLRKIMVPTDNSEDSAEAFKIALDFAEKDGSVVFVLHVVHTGHLTEERGHEPDHTDEINLIEEGWKETEGFVREHKGNRAGVTVEVEVREGEPVQEILKAVKEEGIDLIVIGTHGKKGPAHTLMGSVAEKIVRHASCPVLTVTHRAIASTAA